MWYQIILNVQKWPKYWDFQSFFQYLVKPNVIVWSSSMSADVLKSIHWSSFQNFWKRLNNIPQVIQWVPGKIVHDLIGSSMTYKSFCLFQCIWHQTRVIYPWYITTCSHLNYCIWSQDPREHKFLLLKKVWYSLDLRLSEWFFFKNRQFKAS